MVGRLTRRCCWEATDGVHGTGVQAGTDTAAGVIASAATLDLAEYRKGALAPWVALLVAVAGVMGELLMGWP